MFETKVITGAVAGAVIGCGYFWYRQKYADNTKSIALFTDLEPDDMIAMQVLNQRGLIPKFLFVGEGDSNIKYARAARYCRALGWRNTTIMKSYGSDKLFPGEEFLVNNSTLPPQKQIKDIKTELAEIETYICLKPPRELYDWHIMGEPNLLKDKKLVIYGSFNLRTLKDKYKDSAAISWIFDTSKPFKEVILYESHGGIKNAKTNSFSPESTPRLINAIISNVSHFSLLTQQCMAQWDQYMIDDCLNTMKECDKNLDDPDIKAKYDRNKKCYESVVKFMGKQFVAADPVLALIYDNPQFSEFKQPVDVDVSGRYPVITDNPDSSVFIYRGLNWHHVVDGLTQCFLE